MFIWSNSANSVEMNDEFSIMMHDHTPPPSAPQSKDLNDHKEVHVTHVSIITLISYCH